jgi:hypothetical protein
VARISQLLAVGGLTDISVTAVEHELVVARAEDYWERMLVSSPSRAVVMAAKLSEAEIERLRRATVDGLREVFGEGEVRLVAEAYVGGATKGKGAL